MVRTMRRRRRRGGGRLHEAWRWPGASSRRTTPGPAMAMNGGIEPPEGATQLSLSPSQMTYDQLLRGEKRGQSLQRH